MTIALLRPLVDAGALPPDYPVTLPAAAVINVFLGHLKQHYLQSGVYGDTASPSTEENPS